MEGDSPFELNITIQGKFSWDDEFDDKTVEELLNVNAPALLLSYLRPIVSNITLNGMGNSYDIPFIDFTS